MTVSAVIQFKDAAGNERLYSGVIMGVDYHRDPETEDYLYPNECAAVIFPAPGYGENIILHDIPAGAAHELYVAAAKVGNIVLDLAVPATKRRIANDYNKVMARNEERLKTRGPDRLPALTMKALSSYCHHEKSLLADEKVEAVPEPKRQSIWQWFGNFPGF